MEQCFVICDKNVANFANTLFPTYPTFQIIADEQHKNIETVIDICRWLLSEGADRKSLLYAVGGGVTTDLVGFVAGVYKRGISYINVPTTLLSQVDAGTGGKTGCNLDSYKNMIGLTHFPKETLIYPDVLKTLPIKELRGGSAELLKTFIIKGSDNYEKAVSVLKAQEIDYKILNELVKAAAEVKKEIVSIDPYEQNLRRVLNLGHTFAHAIEWYQKKQNDHNYSHGESVAIGIIEAVRMSEERGFCELGLKAKIEKDFISCHLPTEMPYPRKELMQAIWKDKKVENGKINFIFVEKIGKVIIDKIGSLE